MMAPFSRTGGFTLVEVLIGTTLLTMVVGLLMSGLFSMARSARGGEQRLAEIDAEGSVRSFLRNQLASTVPLTVRAGGTDRVLFEGTEDTLQFVGHLPAHRGGGGLQYLRLSVDRSSPESALVLESRNAWSDAEFDYERGQSAWERYEFLPNIGQVRFSYFGDLDDDGWAQWETAWGQARRLPQLVKLEVDQADGRKWPPLNVSIRTTTAVGQPQLVRTEASP